MANRTFSIRFLLGLSTVAVLAVAFCGGHISATRRNARQIQLKVDVMYDRMVRLEKYRRLERMPRCGTDLQAVHTRLVSYPDWVEDAKANLAERVSLYESLRDDRHDQHALWVLRLIALCSALMTAALGCVVIAVVCSPHKSRDRLTGVS